MANLRSLKQLTQPYSNQISPNWAKRCARISNAQKCLNTIYGIGRYNKSVVSLTYREHFHFGGLLQREPAWTETVLSLTVRKLSCWLCFTYPSSMLTRCGVCQKAPTYIHPTVTASWSGVHLIVLNMGSPPGLNFALFYWKSCSYIPCPVPADLWQLPWDSWVHPGSTLWTRMLRPKVTLFNSLGFVCVGLLFSHLWFRALWEGGCCLVIELWHAVQLRCLHHMPAWLYADVQLSMTLTYENSCAVP